MSQQKLADAMTLIGLPYTRTQVTNLESGRRDTLTIGELLAFAAVLKQPPAVLLPDLNHDSAGHELLTKFGLLNSVEQDHVLNLIRLLLDGGNAADSHGA